MQENGIVILIKSQSAHYQFDLLCLRVNSVFPGAACGKGGRGTKNRENEKSVMHDFMGTIL